MSMDTLLGTRHPKTFLLTLFHSGCSYQSEKHATNKGEMTGRFQFDTNLSRIGLKES